MIRTDYRYDRSERSLEPPDDGIDEEDFLDLELQRELAREARMDVMRDRDLRKEGR